MAVEAKETAVETASDMPAPAILVMDDMAVLEEVSPEAIEAAASRRSPR